MLQNSFRENILQITHELYFENATEVNNIPEPMQNISNTIVHMKDLNNSSYNYKTQALNTIVHIYITQKYLIVNTHLLQVRLK